MKKEQGENKIGTETDDIKKSSTRLGSTQVRVSPTTNSGEIESLNEFAREISYGVAKTWGKGISDSVNKARFERLAQITWKDAQEAKAEETDRLLDNAANIAHDWFCTYVRMIKTHVKKDFIPSVVILDPESLKESVKKEYPNMKIAVDPAMHFVNIEKKIRELKSKHLKEAGNG